MSYCNNLFNYQRAQTVQVAIGNRPLGGLNPIRVQSMTTTNTLDTEATVEQCIQIFDAGADYVRLTAQGVLEAENLKNIKQALVERGYNLPLVADIHFNPKAADVAAKYVEKVRINPGNFAERRPAGTTYTEQELHEAQERITAALSSFIAICKQHHTAVRIGVNHGSLSERMVNQLGDTPEGMVESALEFLRIFRAANFHNLVISMKSSNTRIMVQAVRLLASRMKAEGMAYPLHLGVTEAGNSREGRIKSAVGIGALLADGLGDTIRVSLTEEPAFEIPVAQKLVSYFAQRTTPSDIVATDFAPINPYSYSRLASTNLGWIGGNIPPLVFIQLRAGKNVETAKTSLASALGATPLPDIFIQPSNTNTTKATAYASDGSFSKELVTNPKHLGEAAMVEINYTVMSHELIVSLKEKKSVVIIVTSTSQNPVAEYRSVIYRLREAELTNPIILKREYADNDVETFQLKAAADFGAMLLDGVGDGIFIVAPNLPLAEVVTTSFDILQSARVRATKTEYISCPGCGRTLYNLQEVASQIKARTCHLTGLKIGIMGCIVNGPGEMADADYGYVGAGPGKINLYKQKELIKKNIPQSNALEELISLIRENGDWKEKKKGN